MWSSKEDPLLAPPSSTSTSEGLQPFGSSSSGRPPKAASHTTAFKVYDAPHNAYTHRLDAEEAETATFESVMRRTSGIAKPKLINIAMRAKSLQQLNSIRNLGLSHNNPSGALGSSGGGHQRNASRAQDLLQNISKPEGDGTLVAAHTVPLQHKGLLLSQVDKVDGDVEEDDDEEEEGDDDGNGVGGIGIGGETLPFLEGQAHRYGSVAHALSQARHRKKGTKQHAWYFRILKKLRVVCHPYNLARLLCQAIFHSYFVWFGIPLSALAWFIYYYLGNPELDFLPGTATLAWWLNFAARQLVALDIARMTQWLLLDCLILGSKAVSRLVGPVISLYCIQAKGWPVVLTNWALFDLVFLHGDSKFCTHWLYWTGLHIYSLTHANSGTYVINSSMYLRALLAMLLAGFGTTLKRFWLSFQFSRRQCLEFKPRLEKILVEMILVSEVASFADNAAAVQQGRSILDDPTGMAQEVKKSSSKDIEGIQSVGFEISKGSVDFDDGEDENGTEVAAAAAVAVTTTSRDALLSASSAAPPPLQQQPTDPTAQLAHDMPWSNGKSLAEISSRHLRFKYMLDSWEPPVDKSDKAEVSIRDVLLFQAALMYMNDDKPFGEAFGPASTRDECIQSSADVYTNLLALDTDGHPTLDFEVLALATCNEDGSIDMDKKKMLRRLFRPDANGQITELAFIQSCDAIYKRLCFFRASVGNSSVIDKVLASTVDWFYYFTLTLILLSLLRFNPWALMVSLTSVLVSASFALGSSLSRYVEGILLIAVTRPYDLGDRIYIGTADTIATGGGTAVDVSSHTWFVEDITLTTTTLRFARTNEVSILHNWAIIGSKIINCNRSPGATILLDIKLHISILQGNNLQGFENALQKYVETHPRVWDSLVFCRHDHIDADNEQVTFALGFRHRNSWQDAGRIKINRADLVRFVYELAEQLKINYESPPPRRVTYNAGDLAHGEVESFKTNLLKSGNVICRAREVLMANAADGTATQRSSSLDVLEEEEPTAPLAQGE